MDDVRRPAAGEVKCGLFIEYRTFRAIKPIIVVRWRRGLQCFKAGKTSTESSAL